MKLEIGDKFFSSVRLSMEFIYFDSASLNYPGTDTLVPAIELAEI
jgi:hypothetical protein